MGKGKFINIKEYLKSERRSSFYISFEEIEEIIGQKLCPSAYKYPQYWNPTPTHTFAVMIYECGYAIEADLNFKRIRLYKN